MRIINIENNKQQPSMRNRRENIGHQELARLSLINNLKQKIRSLKQEVQLQKLTIDSFKKCTKNTLINEQQVYIQKLNDQNKRLLLVIQDLKGQYTPLKNIKGITNLARMSVQYHSQTNNKDIKQTLQSQLKDVGLQDRISIKKKNTKVNFEEKYYQILMENERIRRQLMTMKANESIGKLRKPLNERNSLMIENSIHEMDKIRQKNYQLQAQLQNKHEKNQELKQRVSQLQNLLERAVQINKSMKIL